MGIGVVVDDDEHLVHLRQPGFDQPLVTPVQRRELAEREPSLEPGHTDQATVRNNTSRPRAAAANTPILIQNSR